MPVRTRMITLADASTLARLHARNRRFMAPWDALRADVFFTVPGQTEEVRMLIDRHAAGAVLPYAILGDDGEVVGRITLTGIVRGPFQSCSMGYWVDEAANGRGWATEAVAQVVDLAFSDLGLHRVQAETMLANARSQRVLAKNGFERIGCAPGFLRIAGEWEDHLLFQRLAG